MKKKYGLIILILVICLTLIGVVYAFFTYELESDRTEVVTGQIYMDYKENSQISLKDMIPETKEEALARNGDNGVFNFTITGRNTSKYPIYYGISLVNGDVPEGKTTLLKPEHIMIYLERDGEVLIDGIRYSNWDNQRIWVETIEAGTNDNITHNYELRMWIDSEIMVSDTNPDRDYTVEEWNNAYASLKVNVNGNLETMNMPLSIETSDTFVENNNAYFIAKISNFYDISELGKTLDTTDTLNFQVSGTNSDLVFSYKDSEGNVVTETSETLDLTYLFNKNKTVEVQVFVKPMNDANGVTDLTLKLLKNGEVIQDFHKYMNVYGANFCLNNGFNKLYDCILASDSLATDIEAAKVNIANKGEPNLNDTAPSYTYVEDITYDVENVYSVDGQNFRFADSYKFNPKSGNFDLINSDGSSVVKNYLSDTYIGYYTCGGAMNYGVQNCPTIYRIDATGVSGSTYTIIKGDKITSKMTTILDSEVGLYKTEDDYGEAYFYRGDVSNNNVLFGGYYWKILRTNGDNSIRLIYNGSSSNTDNYNDIINNTLYKYTENSPDDVSRKADLTYVGYMYGKDFIQQISVSTLYTVDFADRNYYFADGYEFDEENEVFYLKKENFDLISKSFTEMNNNALFEKYPYTCISDAADGKCEVLIKVKGLYSNGSASVQYISYSSKDKESTRTNEYSSSAKIQIDNWYEKNIVGKLDDSSNLITDYIVDGTFCNDRSITAATYNSGYLLGYSTNYASIARIKTSTVSSTLKCSTDIRDKFSNAATKGNGLLEYPVALITADEVVFAGGKSHVNNYNYYLSGTRYWTMTPAYYQSDRVSVRVWEVDSNGALNSWYAVSNTGGLRPVINLRSDVLISSGDGSVENPFQLKLA